MGKIGEKSIRKISVSSLGKNAKNSKAFRLPLPIFVLEHLEIDENNRTVEIETVQDGILIKKINQ